MSKTMEQLNFLEDVRSDFEEALSQRNFKDCAAIIENLGDLGYENEVVYLHKRLNRAKSYLCTKVDCGEEHGRYCKDFNGGSAGQNEGEVTERALRADETYD